MLSTIDKGVVAYVSLKHLTLTARDMNDPAISYEMQWGFRDNNPRITVFKREVLKNGEYRAFTHDNMLIAPFKLGVMTTLFKTMREVNAGGEGTTASVDCVNTMFEKGVDTGKKYVQAVVTFTKNSDESMTIKVHADDKFTASFVLRPNLNWHMFKKNDTPLKDTNSINKLHVAQYISDVEDAVRYSALKMAISVTNKSRQPREKTPTSITAPKESATPQITSDLDDIPF